MSHKFKHSHLGTLADLLALEAKAEQSKLQSDIQRAIANSNKRTDAALFDLVIRDEVGGLGGRVLVTLSKRNQEKTLPWTRMGVGTPVLLSETDTSAKPIDGEAGWRGVVSRINRESIQVAISDWPDSENDNPRYRLDLSSDAIARQRQEAMLADADNARSNRLAEIRDILLGTEPPHFDPARFDPTASDFQLINQQLDPSQSEAVQFAISATDIGIIQGPPGTGKTTAVVELIRQTVRNGQTVLACAPSNLAVDNIFERLLTAPELSGNGRVIRLGHPARVTPALRDNTLEMLVGNHPDMRSIQKLIKDAHALRRQSGKWTRGKPERGARQDMRQESREMISDARRMEDQLVERVLDSAQVVCATLTGLNPKFVGKRIFDLCVIDEAAQSTEPTCWLPLRHSQRLILAGDQCQLPPTIISKKASEAGFNISLMERLMQDDALSRRLDVQYRMHKEIMTFSSQEFYDETLLADPQVADHLLPGLPSVQESELTSSSVHFIDTAGAGYDEEREVDSESRANPQEADLVCRKVQQLLEADVSAEQISVISPYSAQVRLLRERAETDSTLNGVELNSIDGFQGREQEAIIISLVRSNADGAIGFLSDTRRMNVAMTRARRKLIVIGDSATIGADPFYGRMLDYFDKIGAYHSVWEEEL